jgi:hypothetical protein
VSFDVTDDSGLFREILIAARFEGFPVQELVFNGSAFTPPYAAESSRVAIDGGFHFVVSRRDGWPAAPSITPYAIDQLGWENV